MHRVNSKRMPIICDLYLYCSGFYVYMSNIKEKVNKKIEFGSTISVAKTSVQVAVMEGVTSELIRLLIQFITKYRHNTGLNIKKVYSISHFNNEIQGSFSVTTTNTLNNCQR
jgi:hypothetical protein